MPKALVVDMEEVGRLYLVERLSSTEIAARLGWPYGSTVVRKLKKAGVPLRSASEAASLRKQTPEQIAKRAAAIRGRPSKKKGVPLSDEQRQRMRDLWTDPEYRAHMEAAQRGARHYRWQGGSDCAELRRSEWNRRRKDCYERDGHVCQDCRATGRRLNAHHVIPRRHGGGDELENLVTLCVSCHHKREHRYADCLFA